MNKTEKEIEYQKELKTFRKAMYLVERECLTGWSNGLVRMTGITLTLVWLLLLSLFAGDDLSFLRQVINLLVTVGLFIIFIYLYRATRLFLKWNQLKKRSGYKIDFVFKREKSNESVKI